MLLRESLQDTDIPHRDKLREAIIDKWHEWFDGLKKELNVCPRFLLRLMNSFGLGCTRPDQPYSRYLVLSVACIISRPHCPLDF